MDQSRKYLAMCAAAEEIQDYFNNRDNRIGKTMYSYEREGEIPIGVINIDANKLFCKETEPGANPIWLPTQEELQDICKGESIFETLNDFHLFVFTDSNGGKVFKTRETAQFTSAEQLWLAFLMYSTLQKRWDGEKWKK
jgi:hypothetical protein